MSTTKSEDATRFAATFLCKLYGENYVKGWRIPGLLRTPSSQTTTASEITSSTVEAAVTPKNNKKSPASRFGATSVNSSTQPFRTKAADHRPDLEGPAHKRKQLAVSKADIPKPLPLLRRKESSDDESSETSDDEVDEDGEIKSSLARFGRGTAVHVAYFMDDNDDEPTRGLGIILERRQTDKVLLQWLWSRRDLKTYEKASTEHIIQQMHEQQLVMIRDHYDEIDADTITGNAVLSLVGQDIHSDDNAESIKRKGDGFFVKDREVLIHPVSSGRAKATLVSATGAERQLLDRATLIVTKKSKKKAV